MEKLVLLLTNFFLIVFTFADQNAETQNANNIENKIANKFTKYAVIRCGEGVMGWSCGSLCLRNCKNYYYNVYDDAFYSIAKKFKYYGANKKTNKDSLMNKSANKNLRKKRSPQSTAKDNYISPKPFIYSKPNVRTSRMGGIGSGQKMRSWQYGGLGGLYGQQDEEEDLIPVGEGSYGNRPGSSFGSELGNVYQGGLEGDLGNHPGSGFEEWPGDYPGDVPDSEVAEWLGSILGSIYGNGFGGWSGNRPEGVFEDESEGWLGNEFGEWPGNGLGSVSGGELEEWPENLPGGLFGGGLQGGLVAHLQGVFGGQFGGWIGGQLGNRPESVSGGELGEWPENRPEAVFGSGSQGKFRGRPGGVYKNGLGKRPKSLPGGTSKKYQNDYDYYKKFY